MSSTMLPARDDIMRAMGPYLQNRMVDFAHFFHADWYGGAGFIVKIQHHRSNIWALREFTYFCDNRLVFLIPFSQDVFPDPPQCPCQVWCLWACKRLSC